MISYKDKTFCSKPCGNTQCSKNYTEEEEIFNLASVKLPVAFADFSKDCGEWIPVEWVGVDFADEDDWTGFFEIGGVE